MPLLLAGQPRKERDRGEAALESGKVLDSAFPRGVMRNGFRKQHPAKLFHHPMFHLRRARHHGWDRSARLLLRVL
ncbi:unnamed protein product [Caretta caretta]